MIYEWREFERFPGDKWSGLLPVDEPNNFALSRIASVYQRGDEMYCASYAFHASTGNKPASWSLHKTRLGAKRWIERQLAQFWEPPTIKEPVTS